MQINPGALPIDTRETARVVACSHARLLSFAKSRLRNSAMAEDAVSETVLAALATAQSFSSESQLTAWLFGVLRHKLVDQLRAVGRETPASDHLDEPHTKPNGASGVSPWSMDGVLWHDPEYTCRQRELVGLVIGFCASLPKLQAEAFVMQEILELDPATICARLSVRKGHLLVLLHRARVRLRPLVQANWVGH